MFIAIVVGGMSVGKINSIMNQQRVFRASNVMRTTIEAAFALAVRNRQPVELSWSSSSQLFAVTDRSASTYFRRTSLAQDPYGLPSGSVTVSRTPLEIYPNGLANDTLLITLSANSVTRTIRVSRAGLVQTQ